MNCRVCSEYIWILKKKRGREERRDFRFILSPNLAIKYWFFLIVQNPSSCPLRCNKGKRFYGSIKFLHSSLTTETMKQTCKNSTIQCYSLFVVFRKFLWSLSLPPIIAKLSEVNLALFHPSPKCFNRCSTPRWNTRVRDESANFNKDLYSPARISSIRFHPRINVTCHLFGQHSFHSIRSWKNIWKRNFIDVVDVPIQLDEFE